MERTCTGCHGLGLIAQQRLDHGGWTREVDKMIRWGAPVDAAEKDELVNYLAMLFASSRPLPNTSKTVPEGRGKDIFQTACMSCHDDTPIATFQVDRVGWTQEVDRMINWGAYVPPSRKEDLLDYLVTHFSR